VALFKLGESRVTEEPLSSPGIKAASVLWQRGRWQMRVTLSMPVCAKRAMRNAPQVGKEKEYAAEHEL